jgi:hypothetical protein
MISIAQARSVLGVLIGQPIWNVRRSHGSCFLAELGAFASLHTLPRRVLETEGEPLILPEHLVRQGEFSFLVEECHWQIEIDRKEISDRDEDHARMQSVMDSLEDRTILSVQLSETQLQLELSGDGRFILGPAAHFSGEGEPGSQWHLQLPGKRYLVRSVSNEFYLE